MATLGRIAHDRFVDDEIGSLLERLRPLEESLEYDSDEASLIRVTRGDWDKERRVPQSSAPRCSRRRRGALTWVDARATNDFSSFLPVLERNLELRRRYVECFEWDDSPYTALLDDFEPFMTTTEVAEIFDTVQPVLLELVREAPRVDAGFLEARYPEHLQHEFGTRVAATLGFEEGAWRLDATAHPFCSSFSNRDVRLSTRYHATGLDSFWSTMHEAGHGLYAHGIAPSLERTPLATAPSLGLNESQSRTWENLVARSRPFWAHWYEPLQDTFPEQLGDVGLDDFLAGVNRAEPGPIRIEADETTYSLHVIPRFDLERSCSTERSRRKTCRRRGTPAWRRSSVWTSPTTPGACSRTSTGRGSFGYFPTYALGNVISLQIWSVVREAIPDLDGQLEAGEIGSCRPGCATTSTRSVAS